MKFLKTTFLALSSAFLFSCTETALFAVNAPTAFDGNKRVTGIEFGDHGQSLDIYIPSGTSEYDSKDVLVFIYGGRWSEGSKNDYKFVGSRFASNGYITVIPDYRKYPNVKFPAFVKDNAQAVAWVHENIGRYGGNGSRIFLSGHSAGALHGALLASNEQYFKEEGVDRSVIQAFAGLAGPYDFEPEAEDLKDIFGPPENYPQMQVSTFIDGSEPPMLFLYGGKDTTVHVKNIEKVVSVIKEKGGTVEVKKYDPLDHVGMVSALSWYYNDTYSVTDDILKFFKVHGAQEKPEQD